MDAYVFEPSFSRVSRVTLTALSFTVSLTRNIGTSALVWVK